MLHGKARPVTPQQREPIGSTLWRYSRFAGGPGRATGVFATPPGSQHRFFFPTSGRTSRTIGRNQKFWQTAVGVCFQGRVTEQPRWSRGKKYRISTCNCYGRDRDRQGTTRTIESQNLKNLALSHRNLTVEFTSLKFLSISAEFAN
jgi:hypothetical protein